MKLPFNLPSVPKPLIPVIATVIGLFLVIISLKTCSDDVDSDRQNTLPLDALPDTPQPDADSPADTIKTLTASVSALVQDMKLLRDDNEALRSQNRDLVARSARIEQQVAERIEAELKTMARERSIARRTELDTIRAIQDELAVLTRTVDNQSAIDRRTHGVDSYGPTLRSQNETIAISRVPFISDSNRDEESLQQPIITIPKNSMLLDARALTALVGRVPLEDQIRDPLPFKVIVGGDNVSSNGFAIPHLYGMIWSGIAIGDWTLSCIRGKLLSATYVFDNGSIRTINAHDDQQPLAWISNGQGVPCIPGKRISNAREWLTAQIAAGAVEGAATAAAVAETQRRTDVLGGSSSSVTGDLSKYLVGKSFAHSSEAFSSWLADRASQEFDAIFVEAGFELVIHVEEEIHIDFDPFGRKIVATLSN